MGHGIEVLADLGIISSFDLQKINLSVINIYCLTDKNLRLLFLAGSSRKTDYLTVSVTKEALSHSRDFRFEIKTFIYALTFYFLVVGTG